METESIWTINVGMEPDALNSIGLVLCEPR